MKLILAPWILLFLVLAPPVRQEASPAAQALGAQALAELQMGRYAEAIRNFRAAATLAGEAGDHSAAAAYLFLLATAEWSSPDFSGSPANVDAAIQAARSAANASLEASARGLRAAILTGLGRQGEARADLDTAATLVQQNPDSTMLPVLVLLGQAEMTLGRYRQAAAHFELGLKLQRQLGAEEGREVLLAGLGLALMRQGRFADTLPLYEETLGLAKSRKDEKEEASVLAALGNLSAGSGDHRAARSYFDRAAVLYEKLNDIPSLWLVRINIADLDATEGQGARHEAVYEEAVDVFRRAKDDPKLARALTVLAVQAGKEGRDEAALRLHEEILSIHRRSGDRGGEAQALSNLALTENSLGHPESALGYLEQALTLHREGGNSEREARTLLDSGADYINLGRAEEGLSRVEEALRIARSIADQDLEAKALGYVAQMYFASGHALKAFLKIEEALRIAPEDAPGSTQLFLLNVRGLVLLGLKRPRESLAALAQARRLSQELGQPCEEAQTLFATGAAHLVALQTAEARTAFESARAVQRPARCFVSREMTFFALGAIYEALGQEGLGVDAYLQAIQAFETAMEDIRSDDLLAGHTGQAALVYARLLPLMVQAGRHGVAFTLAEQARGRAFLRQLTNRGIDFRKTADPDLINQEQELRRRLEGLKQQLGIENEKPQHRRDQARIFQLDREFDEGRQNYETLLTRLKLSNPEYASLVDAPPVAISTVQQHLDSETTLVEYFVLDREVLAWVVDRRSYQLIRLPVSRTDLQGKIDLLRSRIAVREPTDALASELYQILFAPLAAAIRHSNLLIVPHGVLHLLPFAALTDQVGQPLIERYTLAFLPSASALPFIQAKRKPVAAPMLALGDPDGSLPEGNAEARAVAQLFDADPLLGSRATESALRERASQAGILHIAAHATFDSARPLFSHISLARDAQNDGELEVHEVFGLDLSRSSLVVLAGCSTGMTKVMADDDFTGLTRAFLFAGTPAVVTTLWVINSEASTELMKIFYGRLRRGDSTPSALREAQRTMRRSKTWRHPYYWAAFRLTGLPDRPGSR